MVNKSIIIIIMNTSPNHITMVRLSGNGNEESMAANRNEKKRMKEVFIAVDVIEGRE